MEVETRHTGLSGRICYSCSYPDSSSSSGKSTHVHTMPISEHFNEFVVFAHILVLHIPLGSQHLYTQWSKCSD
jgi:hypothetical protein